MNTVGAGTILRGFMRLLAFAAAWSIIPIALIIAWLLPCSMLIRLVLIILPVVLFTSCLIQVCLSKPLDRKTSPVSFYAVLVMNILFLLIVFAFIHVGRVSHFVTGIHHLYQTKNSPAIGLLKENNQRYRLMKDGIELYVRSTFANAGRTSVLNYKVQGYSYSVLRFLFDEIFIKQEYYFPADTPRPFVIDCGSHIGMSILYFKALYPEAQVMGFEPAPDTFRLLSENIQQNGLKNVTLLNKAVGKEEGTMKFYGDDSLIASLLNSRGGGTATDVEVVKLSRYIDRPVDFLKLDVEGAEEPVLEDLVATTKIRMIKRIAIEYHHHIDKNADVLSHFLKLLEDNNFGYHLASSPGSLSKVTFQDIMIYAYQKTEN
jgi:FkbM family methyltransferase